ncbi:MAG: hypothetical protein EAZ97_10935 [Bacteroidetes bacterium]|nr:MAG: hypothetical protein EAZ97_10935 [Bacteroidota bacterium]
MLRFFILFFVFFLSLNSVFAQNLRFNRLYQTADGLATGYCKDILQDSIGFIWIATDEGLSRFDGAKFINYRKETSKYFKSFFKQKNGNLLAVGDYGLLKIHSLADTVWFETLIYGKETLSDSTLHSAKSCFEDQNGNLWIAEPNALVRLLPNKKFKRYTFEDKNRSNHYHRSFHFCYDQFNNLWLGSEKGFLFVYDPKTDKFKEIILPNKLNSLNDLHYFDQKLWIAGHGITALTIDEKQNILKTEEVIDKQYLVNCMFAANDGAWYIGLLNEKGMMLLNKNREIKTLYQTNEPEKTIRGVQNIYQGIDENLWVAHDNGLAFFRKYIFKPLNNNLPLKTSVSIIQTSTNEYYSSYNNLHRIKFENNEWLGENINAEFQKSPIVSITNHNNELAISNANSNILFIKGDKISKKFDFSDRGLSIFSLYSDKNKNLWACQAPDKNPIMGLIKIDSNQKITFYEKGKGLINRVLLVRSSPEGQIYAFGQGNQSYIYQYDQSADRFLNISLPLKDSVTGNIAINDAVIIQNKIWLATSLGFFCYDLAKKQINSIDLGKAMNDISIKAIASLDGKVFWLAHDAYGLLRYENGEIVVFDEKSGLLSKTMNYRALLIDNKGYIWVGTTQGLAVSQVANPKALVTPAPTLLKLLINNEKFTWQKNSKKIFDHHTFFKVYFASFSFPADQIQYQYRLLDLNSKDTSWQDLFDETDFTSPLLDEGKYIFQVRALQSGGYIWSQPTSWKIEVELPYYRRPLAYFFYVILFVFFTWGLVKINTRRLQINNKRLQKIVQARTAEVSQQKAELELQRDSILKQNSELYLQKEEIMVQNEELFQQKEEIVSQRDFIERQNKQLSDHNTQIQDSIRAAQSIQQAILPNAKRLENLLGDYFILFRPKDIVSGDFYWCAQVQQQVILAVADCTGHGVSGALVTMIGNMLLDRIIHFKNIIEPAEILTELNREILKAFTEDETRKGNGMDIAIVSIEKQDNQPTEIVFSGAKRPIFYFKQKEQTLNEVKGDRKSIDGNRNENKIFHNHSLFLEKGDSVYLCTDGFADQNNVLRQKLGHDLFTKLLTENANLESYQQKSNLENYLDHFQAGMEQRDDILVIGIKF